MILEKIFLCLTCLEFFGNHGSECLFPSSDLKNLSLFKSVFVPSPFPASSETHMIYICYTAWCPISPIDFLHYFLFYVLFVSLNG